MVLCPQNVKDEDRVVKAYIDADSKLWKVLPCTVRKTYGEFMSSTKKSDLLLVSLLLKHLLIILLFLDSYAKAREMLPMAEDTDGLDTDKESGRGMRKRKRNTLFDDEEEEEDYIQMSKQKGKALPVPPKSAYKKKQFEIKSSSSVRSALQRLKNQTVEIKNRNKINTINEKSQTEEEMVDNIQEMSEKRYVENSNMELEKARKRIQERLEKTRQEKETEAHIREKPGTIDKENQMPNSQYDLQLRSLDLSSVFSPFIGKCH